MTVHPSSTRARAISAPTRFPAPVTMAVRESEAVIARSPYLIRGTKQSGSRKAGLLRSARNDRRTAMPENRPPIDLQGVSFAELQNLIDQQRLPPVESWNPERCGHSGMR